VSGKDLDMASMDLVGDTLALSAFYGLPRAEEDPVMSGNVIVYVFERSGGTWVESFRFVPEEGEKDLLFFPELNVGASVALEGAGSQAELLAVGLPGFPDWSGVTDNIAMFGANPEQIPEFPPSNRQVGAVYIMERNEQEWTQSTVLRPAGWEDPPGIGKMFSEISATSEGEQVSSAEGGLLTAAGIPESFVFPGDIYSDDPEISFFGATVDLDGEQLAVTAGYANATYVFERQGQNWVYKYRLYPSQSAEEFWEDDAQIVAIGDCALLLGTPGEFGSTAHVFHLCDH